MWVNDKEGEFSEIRIILFFGNWPIVLCLQSSYKGYVRKFHTTKLRLCSDAKEMVKKKCDECTEVLSWLLISLLFSHSVAMTPFYLVVGFLRLVLMPLHFLV